MTTPLPTRVDGMGPLEPVPFIDLVAQYQTIAGEVTPAIDKVFSEQRFILGDEVVGLETEIADYCDAREAIGCASGTDALLLALMALDIGQGDEVITTPYSFFATAGSIVRAGATPVFVDIDPGTMNLDPAAAAAAVTPRTRAILPVHLFGQCADMDAILKIATKHNLFVIEDVAQALGAVYTFSDGRRMHAGTMGTIGTTSFFPSKNLGCFGDGGAIFAQDTALADKIKMIANHGQRKKYHHDVIGVNSRLDTIQAAILNVKLKYLNEYERKRNEAATYYDRALAQIPQVKTPGRSKNSTHVFHQYTLCVERRDDLKKYLEDEGIPTMIYYPVPLHFQKAYQRSEFGEGSFPVTENLSKTVISLPIHTEMKMDEQEFICNAIKKFYND